MSAFSQMHDRRPMYLAVALTVLLTATSFVPARASAQASPASTAQESVEHNLQRRPLDIENSQPDAHEEYLLGAGDDITVSVAGRPELSGPHTIGPDGRITLPVVGSVDVAEKSRDDAAKSIDAALSKDYTGTLTSVVQVNKYASNHITIYGAVEHTGVISFDQPPSLMDALARGGSLINVDHSVQMPKKCVIYRGDDKILNVNLSDRFTDGKALTNIRLRRNDVVYFPENQESLVSVIGEVTHNGPERLTSRTTVIQLISAAGGITEKAGTNPEIQIAQPSTGKVQKVRYKDLLDPRKGSDIALHDGDIVLVPRSGLAKAGFVFSQVSPILGIATLATLIVP